MLSGQRAPGDFQFGMSFASKDEAKFKNQQLAELKVPPPLGPRSTPHLSNLPRPLVFLSTLMR